MEHQTKDINQTLPSKEVMAEVQLDLGLKNIDDNLTELVQKLQKPRQQVQYVADNWRQWRHNAVVIAAFVGGLWLTRKIIHKF